MQKTYALFDFDGTLIRGDSILLLVAYARRRRWMTLRQLTRALVGGALYGLRLRGAVPAKEQALAFLVGRGADDLAAIVAAFFHDVLEPRLRPDAMEAIARHRAAGHEVLLISASAAFYLEPLRHKLGLADIIATRMDLDLAGRLTGRVCGDNCRGVQKALRLAEYLAAKGDRLDFETSFAYGDSAGDLPMLRLTAHPVAVNPKRKLWRALQNDPTVTRVHWAEPGQAPLGAPTLSA